MKKLLLLFFSLIPLMMSALEADIMEKERLGKLLEERKEKFSTYFNSIEKRSGIFGNKTKKDIQQSNEVLIDIVKTDNNIISVLNRAIDYKSFEKTEFNYDKLEQDKKISRLHDENTALSEKLTAMSNSLRHSEKQVMLYRSLLYLLIIGVSVAYYILKRRKAL